MNKHVEILASTGGTVVLKQNQGKKCKRIAWGMNEINV